MTEGPADLRLALDQTCPQCNYPELSGSFTDTNDRRCARCGWKSKVMPGDIRVVSFSELDTYRQCPLKHQLGYKERWTKPLQEGDRRATGTLWHSVLEDWYRAIKRMTKEGIPADEIRDLAWAEAIRHLTPEQDTEQSESQALVEWMFEGYVDLYGIDEQWMILGIETKLQAPLPTPQGRDSRFHVKAKLDLIVRDLDIGGLMIVDHKSGANLPNQMDLEIDDQFGLYTWLMRQRGHKIQGSIHSAARTKRNLADFPDYAGKAKAQTPEDRMRRTYLNRSDAELTNLANDAYAVAYNAYPPESRKLPLYSSPDSRQCGWKCDFKEAHLAARSGRDLTDMLEESGFVRDFTRH